MAEQLKKIATGRPERLNGTSKNLTLFQTDGPEQLE